VLVVLDAGTVVDLVLGSERARRVPSWALDADAVAPALLDGEVVSAVARLERADEVSSPRAAAAVRALTVLPVERLPLQHFSERAWALRGSLRISDAYYVALAKAVDATLVTTDGRIARSGVRGLSITVVS
jgi:predicted nucleic acid-binding protein